MATAGKKNAANQAAIEVSTDAQEIAKQYKKTELVNLAKEHEVKYPPKATEAEIAQLLLEAGVFEEDDDNADDDTGEEGVEDSAEVGEEEEVGEESAEEEDEEESEEEDTDESEDEGEDESEEEEEEEVGDALSTPPGKFVYRKVGTTAKVYWPDGRLLRTYTKANIKNSGFKTAAEAAKGFCDKKNNQIAGGSMPREAKKATPQYPKGMTRPTNYKTGN